MDRHNSEIDYDAVIRDAKRLRAKAIADGWHALVDYLSPRMPKLFPAEF